jgi:peptidoglycan endopeptidase LytE
VAAYAGFQQPAPAVATTPASWQRIKASIETYLRRPYVWGSSGLKSFDCSGFVWRVMYENGILFKRTTARKLYMSFAAPAEGKNLIPGNLVFFDNLKHCGIVNDDNTFYHAQSSIGTNLSKFNPYWRRLVVGYRCIPDANR